MGDDVITCSLDLEHSETISALLKPPSPQQVQEYFSELVKARQCRGLEVKTDGEYGKGVYANSDFSEGKLVLKDQILVGAQHSSNKVDCLVCSYCFRFIGSIELQIGRKLYLQNLGLSASMKCESSSSYEENDSLMTGNDNGGSCSSSEPKEKVPLHEEVIESLMNGGIVLPYAKQFSLPSSVQCSGGCGEALYCSKFCAEADWESFHSILCTGERSKSSCREALLKFIEHANDTNDIFILAAKAISFTILRYKKLKESHLNNRNSSVELKNGTESLTLTLLLEVWKPMSMGYKKRWWECVALPKDVDCCHEASFRSQLKELAFTSLQLLKKAIFDKECAPCIL